MWKKGICPRSQNSGCKTEFGKQASWSLVQASALFSVFAEKQITHSSFLQALQFCRLTLVEAFNDKGSLLLEMLTLFFFQWQDGGENHIKSDRSLLLWAVLGWPTALIRLEKTWLSWGSEYGWRKNCQGWLSSSVPRWPQHSRNSSIHSTGEPQTQTCRDSKYHGWASLTNVPRAAQSSKTVTLHSLLAPHPTPQPPKLLRWWGGGGGESATEGSQDRGS